MTKMPPRTNLSGGRVAASKGVAFSSNPILQVKLPAWRSRFSM